MCISPSHASSKGSIYPVLYDFVHCVSSCLGGPIAIRFNQPRECAVQVIVQVFPVQFPRLCVQKLSTVPWSRGV